MNNRREICSSYFTWKGNTGVAMVPDRLIHFNPFNGSPVEVVSDRTQNRVLFTLDYSVPGCEDGWDGMACHYVSAEGFKIVFYND